MNDFACFAVKVLVLLILTVFAACVIALLITNTENRINKNRFNG